MTVRVGIIGTGGISRAHQSTYEKVGGFEIVAVCDIIKSKANQAAEEWGVPKKNAFSSYNKMLEMDAPRCGERLHLQSGTPTPDSRGTERR